MLFFILYLCCLATPHPPFISSIKLVWAAYDVLIKQLIVKLSLGSINVHSFKEVTRCLKEF